MSRLAVFVVVSVVVALGYVAGEIELRLKPFGDSFTKSLSSSIVFSCEVVGDTREGVNNYNIRWFNKNDEEIVEKTGRLYVEEDKSTMKKLYITNIERKDEGRYKCVAMIDGQERSRAVNLILYKEITFDHAPSPQHPAIHSDPLIECRVSGLPEPTVSWRYRGERIAFGGRHKEEANGIRIRNITREDDGEYICRAEVETDGRYNERKISVIVHIPPSITKGPGKLEEVEGEDTLITCKADGLPQPKFEFLKDGDLTPLQSSSRIHVDSDGGSVSFRPLNKSDEGKYTCRVNNDVGSTSEEGYLRVLVKPFIHQFKSIVHTEGDNVKWECLSHGDPAPEMKFQKLSPVADYITGDGEDDRVTVERFEGRLQMTIESIIPDDMSNYTCRSSNNIGSSESTASLTVRFRPRFPDNHTKAVYIWAGRTRNITCHIRAYPEPSMIKWFHKGIPLSSNDTYRIFSSGLESSLEVRVRESDQGWIYGNYTCQASNELGTNNIVVELKRASVPSQPRSVNVTELMPNSVRIIVIPPEENGGEEITGYRVEFEEVMLDFTKVNMNDSRESGLEPSYSSNPAALDVQGSKIEIDNLKPSTNYVLKVRAKNDVGVGNHIEHHVRTQSVRRPYPITIMSSSSGVAAFNYNIEWEKPQTGGNSIKEYEFRYRKMRLNRRNEGTAEEWQTHTVKDESDHPMVNFVLENLLPESFYQLEIRVRNDFGWSDASNRFEFSTRQPTEAELIARSSTNLGVVVGIVIFISILILVAIDVGCYFVNGCGVTKNICVHACGEKKQRGNDKTMEEGERQKLKDGIPDGKHETGDEAKEELTLQENVKLMANKD